MNNLVLGLVLVVGAFLLLKTAIPVKGKSRRWVKEPMDSLVALAVVGGWGSAVSC